MLKSLRVDWDYFYMRPNHDHKGSFPSVSFDVQDLGQRLEEADLAQGRGYHSGRGSRRRRGLRTVHGAEQPCDLQTSCWVMGQDAVNLRLL